MDIWYLVSDFIIFEGDEDANIGIQNIDSLCVIPKQQAK